MHAKINTVAEDMATQSACILSTLHILTSRIAFLSMIITFSMDA